VSFSLFTRKVLSSLVSKLKSLEIHSLDIEDELIRDNIIKAYELKKRKKGARQIKMTLEGQFGITYNLKHI